MIRRVPHADKQAAIHGLLLECAKSSPIRLIHYRDLAQAVGMPQEGPWDVLDEISKEERQAGRPDLTFLAISAETKFSSKIGNQPANPPSGKQMDDARAELDKIIAEYNQTARNPYR